MSETHTQLAFDLAYTQLRAQKEDLRNARNQAGMAAAMTGLIATVFATIINPDGISTTGPYSFLSIKLDFWLVIVTLSASLYFAAMVSTAHRTCTFELSANWVLGRKDDEESIGETKVLLAKDCERFFDDNEKVILEARNNLWWSIMLGCAQIPAWLYNLV